VTARAHPRILRLKKVSLENPQHLNMRKWSFRRYFKCTLIIHSIIHIEHSKFKRKNLGNRQDIKCLKENWTGHHKDIYER